MFNQLSPEEQNKVVRSMMAGLPASNENASRARAQLTNNADLAQTMMRRAGLQMPGGAETTPEDSGEFVRAENIRRQMGASGGSNQAPMPQARPSNAGAPRSAPVPANNPRAAQADAAPDESMNANSRAGDQAVTMDNPGVPQSRPEMANQRQMTVDAGWNPAIVGGTVGAAIAAMYGARRMAGNTDVGSIDMRETGYREGGANAGEPAARMMDQTQLNAQRQLPAPEAIEGAGADLVNDGDADNRAPTNDAEMQQAAARDVQDRVEQRVRGRRGAIPNNQAELDALMAQTDGEGVDAARPPTDAKPRRRTSAADLEAAQATRGVTRNIRPPRR